MILQNTVDADENGVAPANDVVGIPFTGGLFRTRLLAWNTFGNLCKSILNN